MKKISIPILSIITGVSAALLLSLRIICLFFFYDDIGYYKSNTVLPIISNILFGLTLIFFLVTAIFSIDKKQSIEKVSKLSQYASLLPMGALIYQMIQAFMPTFNDTNVNKYLFALSAAVAAVFFFLLSFTKEKYRTVTFYLGIGALLYVFLCWMVAYFDFFTPINSTDKVFFYLACAGAVIFIFNEMCACYGFVRARFYYFSLFSSITVLAVSSISAIVGYACGILRSRITLEADIFFAALLIYAITRLIDAQQSKAIIEEAQEETEATNEETQENVDDDSE